MMTLAAVGALATGALATGASSSASELGEVVTGTFSVMPERARGGCTCQRRRRAVRHVRWW